MKSLLNLGTSSLKLSRSLFHYDSVCWKYFRINIEIFVVLMIASMNSSAALSRSSESTWFKPQSSCPDYTGGQGCPTISQSTSKSAIYIHIYIKPSHFSSQGFLKPLPVSYRAQLDISVDYIISLSIYEQNSIAYKHLLIIIYRLTKIQYFISIKSISAEDLVIIFITKVYTLHSCQDNIISDTDT